MQPVVREEAIETNAATIKIFSQVVSLEKTEQALKGSDYSLCTSH
jgi:hypothetical protein